LWVVQRDWEELGWRSRSRRLRRSSACFYSLAQGLYHHLTAGDGRDAVAKLTRQMGANRAVFGCARPRNY
jgi:hypothetical protein